MNNEKRRFNIPGLRVITNDPIRVDINKMINPPPKKDPNLKKQDYLVRKMVYGTAFGFVMLELTNGITYIVDGTLISHYLGDVAFAACGMTGLCYSIIAMISGVVSAGITSICSKQMSQGAIENANKAFSMAVALVLFLSNLLLIAGITAAEPIAELLGAGKSDIALHNNVVSYVKGFFIGAPPQAMLGVLIPQVQLDGGTKRIKNALLALTVTDIGFDFLNIFVIKGGMMGMALATSMSYYVAMFILFMHFVHEDAMFKISIGRVDFRYIGQMLKVGLPLATKRIGNILRPVVMNRVIISTGGAFAMSAYTTQLNFRTFTDSLGIGLGAAVYLITSMFVGEKDKTSTKQTFLSAVRYIMVSIVPVAVVYFIAAPYIARIYNNPSSSFFVMSVLALRMHAVSLPFLAFNEMYNSYVQALGRIKLSHVLTFCSRFLYISLISMLLSKLFGVIGLLVAIAAAEVMLTVTILIATLLMNLIKPVKKGEDRFRVLNKAIDDDGTFLEISITDGNQIGQMMAMVEGFCNDCIENEKKRFFVQLFVEEMTVLIIERGFDNVKEHSVDIRIFANEDSLIIRTRDDCKALSMKEKQLIINEAADDEYMGMKLVKAFAKDVHYLPTMNMNNFMIEV
ncbi:MAG: hypothetical protein II699_06740 [Lachnospiraceae bacterium]|nr:hypothetical protein [Lachnospiraceae bacterium]